MLSGGEKARRVPLSGIVARAITPTMNALRLCLIVVPVLACNAVNGTGETTAVDGGGSATTGPLLAPSADGNLTLDLRAIDEVCTRLLACGVAPRLNDGQAGYGDCRLALGSRAAGQVFRASRSSIGGMTTSNTQGSRWSPAAVRSQAACALAATSCSAVARCVGRASCPTGRDYCDGNRAVYCPPSGYGTVEDCAAQGATCGVSSDITRCIFANGEGAITCEGNTLVAPGLARIDCGAGGRCSADGTASSTNGSCEPQGTVCVVGLDGSRHCGGWERLSAREGASLAPVALRDTDRPQGDPCADPARASASQCVDGTRIRFCLGNTSHEITCSDVGAQRCVPSSDSSGNVRGACE